MNTPTHTPAAGRSRAQLWLLIVLFFAPLMVAFLLYYGVDGWGVDGWRPAGRTHGGDLIQPPRPLPQTALADSAGEPLPADLMRGKWTLVYIGEGGCTDARCRQALTLTRQVRLALNEDMHRVQRVFLATGECCDRLYLGEQHPDLIVAPTQSAAAQELLEYFPGAEHGASQNIYIVDPLGNLMMSYPPGAPDKGLLKDLEKLLKLSHIG